MIESALRELVAAAVRPLVEEIRALRDVVELRFEQPAEWLPTHLAAQRIGKGKTRRALDALMRRRDLVAAGIVRRDGGRWLWNAARLSEIG